MVKSNKKTFILIGVYTVILLAIAGAFLFMQNTANENATTQIYMTTKVIQAGETVDDTLIAKKLKKVDYPQAAVDEIEANGGEVVTSTAQISSLIAVGTIPAGQPITKQLFEAIAPSVYGDYTDKTFGLSSGVEWKFETPNYIVLAVNETNTPIDGFAKGDEISIEGYQKYTYEVTNDDGEAQLMEGTFNGILTNHAVVHSLVLDEAGLLTNVGVIVEQSEYPIISTIAKNGQLTFHAGYIEKWETTVENETTELLYGSGLTLEKLVEVPTILTYTSLDGEIVEEKLSDFTPQEEFDENISVYPTFIQTMNNQADKQYDISFSTPYGAMKIIHYNLDGSSGQYMDATGLNTNKSYDSKTGLFSTVFKESFAEGYYEILLGVYNEKVFVPYQKVCFVIEYEDYNYKNEDGDNSINLDLTLNYLTEKDSYSESDEELKILMEQAIANNPNYKGYIVSDVFNDIAEKQATYTLNETDNSYLITWKDENEYLNTYTSSENLLTKEMNNYVHNGESFKIVVGFEELEKVESVYVYLGCQILLLDGTDGVKQGTKIQIAQIINKMYENYAIKLSVKEVETTEETEAKTIAAYQETDDYKTANFSILTNLSNSEKMLYLNGIYSKTYFENLLIRGIDLSIKIDNLNNLSFNNLFNNVDSYGMFGNQEIKEVNVIMDYGMETELKLQLFYSFTATRYYTDKDTVENLAAILNVDADTLYNILGFVPGKNSKQLSKESVQMIIDNLTSEEVINSLNNNQENTQDFLKLIGFVYTNSPIDLSNLYVYEEEIPSEVEGGKSTYKYTKMFNTDDLVSFIENLKVEFVLENGETVITNVKINY